MEKPTKLFDFDSDDVETLMVRPLFEGVDILFKSVKALPCWTERSIGVTNAVISYWAGRSIAWSGRADIGDVRSLIRRIKAIQPEENQPSVVDVKNFYTLWSGIVLVLEARVHLLDYNNLEKIQREKL